MAKHASSFDVAPSFARYGTNGVGEGEFDDNRSARGYDWYWNGPPSYVPNYASWVANQ